MADDHSSVVSPSSARPKGSRSTTSGTVRQRTSPPPGTQDQNGDGRPPTKRARKAINCEPCRNSKLKCDRNRPCSSCVLRGTSAMCYQDGRGNEGDATRGDDHQYTRIDPAQELSRIRHSLSLVEAYIYPNHRASLPRRPPDAVVAITPKKEAIDPDVKASSPGVMGTQTAGGFYAGPTSAATHLLMGESREFEDPDIRQPSQDNVEEYGPAEYDRDLLGMLPSIDVIDGLINFYFEYCNWIYRHINQSTFTQQWERFKNGISSDRITLATACAMMALATQYLPAQHPLLEGYTESPEEIGLKFWEISGTSLQRRLAESRSYTLELVEVLLCRCHFLTMHKNDSEEIWSIRGEIVTIAMAMGLHRDPTKWRKRWDQQTAERRRWAWWHIVLLERWQAFMFGRPLAFASHHFDTQLPSYCDPAVDKTGRLYLPNIALFRLAFILGDIVDDALSVRPVPYENVQANDRALTQWMENLPAELDLDEYRVARSLASPNLAVRRLGVQSIIIRTSYYHIRFTLHRPHASSVNSSTGTGKSSNMDANKTAQSLEIAVSAAEKLITMVGQSRPDIIANASLAVPAHMNWGPFHCFSAAMFFSFQLIASPDQPGAGLFRASIRKAMSTLEQCRGSAVADKAFNILQTLAPLYSPEYPHESTEGREKTRTQIFGHIRKLAFPYYDSRAVRRNNESPNGRGSLDSPPNSTSVSPPLGCDGLPSQGYDPAQVHNVTTMRSPTAMYPHGQPVVGHMQSLESPHSQNMIPGVMPHQPSVPTVDPAYQNQAYPMSTQPVYDTRSYNNYNMHPVDETGMWSAAAGFGHGEWTQILDGLRPEVAATSMPNNHNRHMPTS
ncbi:hypothetical protein P691DRAFT_722737 [Macrolepiota fuliginosa MF-IS2]|uniref:Zn(2)-C6 fungal-type domain-containing protein n=1 Tax=Macrolepiota fuliginosa MF-IS2 TaxID=1400762 RepID=A0A9P6C536_9AGAR|nr:hypothetical protein P691DRAFT_722737 [Macrolepiota fuliginosa MF-IS2]